MVTQRPTPKVSEDETIRSLNMQLADPSLKSSVRILILILLAMNKKLSSVELRTLIGLGKGSLENHIEKLEAAGYIRIQNVQSWGGARQVISITDKGLVDCRLLLQKIHSLDI